VPPSGPNYGAAVQVLTLLRRLEATARGRLAVNALAEELGVHRRTVLRWADALGESFCDEAGRPLVVRERVGGAAWLRLNREETPLAGTIYQYAAARAAALHLTGGRGSLLGDAAEDAAARLSEELPGSLAAMVARVETAFHYLPYTPRDHRGAEEVLDRVVQATLRCQPLALTYRRPGADRWAVRVEPFTLVMYRDGFYLLGRVARSAGAVMRTFALERVEEAVIDRSARFEVPAGFAPQAFFAGRLGLWQDGGPPERVEIAFAAAALPWARERLWPGSAGWRDLPDGREALLLDVPVTPELVSWVLSWGPRAEALAPASLRAAITASLRAAQRLYEVALDPAEETDAG
jgi:predicted DNA-binding transcriptional regulator YafY